MLVEQLKCEQLKFEQLKFEQLKFEQSKCEQFCNYSYLLAVVRYMVDNSLGLKPMRYNEL